jgi:transposase
MFGQESRREIEHGQRIVGRAARQGLSVEKIAKRFGKHPSTVSYWMAKYGLEAVNRDKQAARGGIERELLEPLVEAGMTIAEIAQELDLSTGTVRLWLQRHGIRTLVARRVQTGRAARGRPAF